MFRLYLRSATRCDSLDSAATLALIPASEELGSRASGQQPFAALLCCFYVRDNSRGIKLGPHWIHWASAQPQLGHWRALVLCAHLHSLRGAVHQCRSLDHPTEMSWQQLFVPWHQFEAPNDVHQGARSQRKYQSTRIRRGKWAADASLQSAVASFMGHAYTPRHHATFCIGALSAGRPLRGSWL